MTTPAIKDLINRILTNYAVILNADKPEGEERIKHAELVCKENYLYYFNYPPNHEFPQDHPKAFFTEIYINGICLFRESKSNDPKSKKIKPLSQFQNELLQKLLFLVAITGIQWQYKAAIAQSNPKPKLHVVNSHL